MTQTIGISGYVQHFAIKSGLGEGGVDIWDAWSRTSDKYQERTAISTWKSAKAVGGITLGWLFWMAKRDGWTPDVGAQKTVRDLTLRVVANDDQDRKLLEEQRIAAELAEWMLPRCERLPHPYLDRKGFPEMEGAVYNGDLLLVPISHLLGSQDSIGAADRRRG